MKTYQVVCIFLIVWIFEYFQISDGSNLLFLNLNLKTGKEEKFTNKKHVEIFWLFKNCCWSTSSSSSATHRYHDNIPLLDFNIGFLTFYEYYNDFCQMEIDKLIASAFGLSKIVKSCNAFFNKSFLTKEK